VLEVSAVGPSEFAHYAARSAWTCSSIPIHRALVILVKPPQPAPGRQAVTISSLFQPEARRYDDGLPYIWLLPPQTGTKAPAGLTWTVGAVTQETPLGFLGVTLVPMLIVSDAVFDGLSAGCCNWARSIPGAMTLKSDDPDAALEPSNGSTRRPLGGNFSYYSMAEFNKSTNLKTLMMNLFFYGS